MARLLRLLALCLVFCGLAAPTASAQQRATDDMFTVSGVRVDETAKDARQARAQAFARSEEIAFARLAERFAGEGHNVPMPDQRTLERLVISKDVLNERSSRTRYIALLSVRFNPLLARPYLEQQGVTVAEQRGPATLIAVSGDPAAAAAQQTAPEELWRAALAEGGFAGEVAPVFVAPALIPGAPSMEAALAYANDVGAQEVVYAGLTRTRQAITSELTRLTPAGPQSLGTVSVALPRPGAEAEPADYQRLADAANARLQAEWRSLATAPAVAAAPGYQLSASALYRSLRDWRRIREGLVALGRAGVITEIRIEAVAREGALVSFASASPAEALPGEFTRRGLAFTYAPEGAIIRLDR